MRLLVPLSKASSHEEIFVEHYDWLVKWALHLSRELDEDANDLVHDLYLQLIRSRPNLDTTNEDRVRGYLYTMLHNLAISKARRSGHDPLSSLMIVDYDCVEYGLASVDRTQLVFVRSDLARICEYAALRKHTSRAASILILRFFLSYYPGEIVRILQTTRVAVEKHLQAARLEAKAYLRRPQSLRFLGYDVTPPAPSTAHLPDNPIALFAELRNRLLNSDVHECGSGGAIEGRYVNDYTPMEASELAHIVGCARCLDRINTVLGLPSLAQRFPADAIDRDPGGDEPPVSPDGVGNSSTFRKKFQHTYEHQPRKLQIAVDGEVRAAQRVSMARCELQVKLDPLRRPLFLEVFSEQGLRLLYLQLDNSTQRNPEPEHATAALSDGRSIELHLSLAQGAAVASAIYRDPHGEEILNGDKDLSADAETGTASRFGSPPRSWSAKALQFVVRHLRSSFSGRPFRLPALIGVALAALCVVVLHNLIRQHSPVRIPAMTAASVLARSNAAEASRIADGGAIHSTFSLETLSGAGNILDTQTVERWDSLKPHRTALRLLDGKGATLAGRWRIRQGRIVTYTKRHGLRSVREAQEQKLAFQDAWELIPGASVFSVWNDLQNQASVDRTGTGYEIRYERLASRPKPGILRASLVLDASAVRPLREDVVLEENGETREYRFRQITYEVVPQSQVQDSDFAPPVTLAASSSHSIGSGEAQNRDARLMLAALYLVDHLSPDVAEFLDVDRRPDGGVSVSGVVPTAEQRHAIEKLLLPLRGTGNLHLALHSNQEAPLPVQSANHPVHSAPVAVVPVENTRIPFDPDLRAVLSSRGLSGPALDDQIRQIADTAVSEVTVVHREGWTLRQIAAADFSVKDIQSLRPRDKSLWLILLRDHTRLLDQQLVGLNMDLKPLLSAAEFSQATQSKRLLLANTSRLADATTELAAECDRLDLLLTAGMTLSGDSSTAPPSIPEVTSLLASIRAREQAMSTTLGILSAAAQSEQ